MAKKRQDNENKSADVVELANSAEPEFDIFHTPVKGQSFFGFLVGGMGFMVPIDLFCEVLDKFQVNRLPNVQPWFHGLINLRGNLVPVFDLRLVLDKSITDTKKRQLFVIGRGEKAVAIWVDTYPEILTLSKMQLQKNLPELPDFLQKMINRVFAQDGKTWLECDLDSLFTALGRRQIATEDGATA